MRANSEGMTADTVGGQRQAPRERGEASLSERRDWDALYRAQHTAAHYDRRFKGGRRAWNNRWIWRVVAAELRRLAGGAFPELVVDAPAGTGRFTRELEERGARVLNLDRSPIMLAALRERHAGARCVAGDLRRPPLRRDEEAVVLCLRLMQHLRREERIAALRGLRLLAPRALVAYYPGWHVKRAGRWMRYKTGLPYRSLREFLPRAALRAEAAEAGWNLRRVRPVLPLLSENVLLLLDDTR